MPTRSNISRLIEIQSSAVYSLKASALELTASDHPNKMTIKGVLVRLDEPSTKPPNGADGHRILIRSEVAQARLSTLKGMGLNYSKELNAHAQRRKVGVIERAWIDGKDLWVQGTVWKRDFPEAEVDLKKPGLGMSMELSHVHVEDQNAQIWELTDFYFTGATILKKDAAAYYRTQAIAAKAEERRTMGVATKKKTTTTVAQVAASAAESAVKKIAGPILSTLEQQTSILASLAGRLERVELDIVASGKTVEADDEVNDLETNEVTGSEDVEVEAKHKEPDGDEGEDDEDDEDEEDMESSVDKGDLEEMGPGPSEDENDKPGAFNKGATNKGSKTTSEDKVGPNVSKAVTGSQVAVLRKQVKAQAGTINKLQAQLQKAMKQLKTVGRQVTAAAENTSRRSLSPEIAGLLKKSGVNVGDLEATGSRLSTSDVDGILAQFEQASGVRLDPTKRIEMKNHLFKSGLMEDGTVDRGYTR